jgi:glycopeptide antibiotics resistance protein
MEYFVSLMRRAAAILRRSSFWVQMSHLMVYKPALVPGLAVAALLLFFCLRKTPRPHPARRWIFGFLLYYYACAVFANIVGIPTWQNLKYLYQWKHTVFNPRLILVPFQSGVGLGFMANIVLFVPFGLLVALLAPLARRGLYVVSVGFFLSLFIELSQIFTASRVTDISDLIANTLGAAVGYVLFALFARLFARRKPRASAGCPGQLAPLLLCAAAGTVFFF